MAITTYPSTFRLPEWNPYGMETSSGLSRSTMESGYTRQRRRYNNLPTRIRMVIAMKWSDLHAWQAWWNANAYTWFKMPAVTGFVPPSGTKDCAPHVMRCISDLSIQVGAAADWCKVNFEVELSPGTLLGTPEENAIVGV
jgi:hypothetical protein